MCLDIWRKNQRELIRFYNMLILCYSTSCSHYCNIYITYQVTSTQNTDLFPSHEAGILTQFSLIPKCILLASDMYR